MKNRNMEVKYIVNQIEYVDMNTIILMFDSCKSQMIRLMNEFSVSKTHYQNKFLYKKDEVIKVWKQELLKNYFDEFRNQKISMSEMVDLITNENDSYHISEKNN